MPMIRRSANQAPADQLPRRYPPTPPGHRLDGRNRPRRTTHRRRWRRLATRQPTGPAWSPRGAGRLKTCRQPYVTSPTVRGPARARHCHGRGDRPRRRPARIVTRRASQQTRSQAHDRRSRPLRPGCAGRRSEEAVDSRNRRHRRRCRRGPAVRVLRRCGGVHLDHCHLGGSQRPASALPAGARRLPGRRPAGHPGATEERRRRTGDLLVRIQGGGRAARQDRAGGPDLGGGDPRRRPGRASLGP